MSRLSLPAGQTLKEIARRLGVSVEALLPYAGLTDADAPLVASRVVEVPDGLLRGRVRDERQQGAIMRKSAKHGGMNSWLALDIEHKRTRAAGGVHTQGPGDSEREALAEARRTFLRFEADSNELCITLFGTLGASAAVEIRAPALALQACAHALRHLFFGEPPDKPRAAALSSAKAAVNADPKLDLAHLGMAQALECGADAAALQEARAELEFALAQVPDSGVCLAELGRVLGLQGEQTIGLAAAARAVELDASCLLAQLVYAELLLAAREPALALAHFEAASQVAPSFADAFAGVARALRQLGRDSEAERAGATALTLATTDLHRARIRSLTLAAVRAP